MQTLNFDNIFSITDYKETHRLIKIFGIKIKFPKKEFRMKRNDSEYYYYKKNNIDIRTIPPATGQIRKIQLANLELLKELDYVCKENNLTYWLEFGTLLGAKRHKGFIPWDDDVDTGMPKQDYNKIIEAFEKSSRNPDIHARIVQIPDTPSLCFIKVIHKKAPHLFVDIFPYDKIDKKLSKKEQQKFSNIISKGRKKFAKNITLKNSIEEVLTKLEDFKKSINLTTFADCQSSDTDLVWGVEYGHDGANWIHSYDTIFPLREIEFEGLKFPCINKPEEYLQELYGDYMAYPKKIGMGHTMYKEFSQEEMEVIEGLITHDSN